MEGILDKVREEDFSADDFLNARDDDTWSNFPDTAMHIACRTGHVPLIRTLMAAGADWNLLGKSNQTAKQEADYLERGNPDQQHAHRQIMELLSESLPPATMGYRSDSVCVCAWCDNPNRPCVLTLTSVCIIIIITIMVTLH